MDRRQTARVPGVDDFHWRTGVLVGIGAEARMGRLRFVPEVRYGYWGRSDVGLRPNQVDLRFGFRF